MGSVGLGWDLWAWDGNCRAVVDPWGWDGICGAGMEICGAGMGIVGLGWDLWGWDEIHGAGMGIVGLGWDLDGGSMVLGWDLWGWDTIPWVSLGTIPPGLHTIQWLYSCDLLSDGSVRGSQRLGYDGRDFISFELGSKSFVAADDAAEITRRHWEDENEVERQENNLKHVCPEWLRKYVRYGQKELERKVAPDVHVSGKEEHGTLILSCHVYGFYPNIITVNWMKGGEIWDQETEWGGIVPNSDGTFHTWARIEALPEEWEQYRCRVEHPGMLEPGIFAWEPTYGGNLDMVIAVSVIAAVLILVLIGFGIWRLQSGNTRDGDPLVTGDTCAETPEKGHVTRKPG
uniref:Class I histocompatibility antigen, F10 alpha chain-like n=1 Tax=Cyanistes caeruleus TaxID=156563 RepID=A0A8C0UG85_CYACU